MLKLPKELDLPAMKDHQMFDRPRIVQLQNELQDKFKALKVFYGLLISLLFLSGVNIYDLVHSVSAVCGLFCFVLIFFYCNNVLYVVAFI